MRDLQKSRELVDTINELKEYLSFDDNGIKPTRTNVTRWFTHKLCTMKRVVSTVSMVLTYTHHLASLSVDPSAKSTNQTKLI